MSPHSRSRSANSGASGSQPTAAARSSAAPSSRRLPSATLGWDRTGIGIGIGIGLGLGLGFGACLAPTLERLTALDAKLADQLRRAAQSIPLNITEANRRTGRDRCNRFRIALGSAAEVTSCLDAAVALGYAAAADHADAQALADRVRALTYRLANPRHAGQ